MRSRLLSAIIGVLLAATAAVALGTGPAQAAPCPSLYVVAIPGTWETSSKSDASPVSGPLTPVTNGLPANVRTDYVRYAATAFPWESEVYGRSKLEAVDNARGMVAAMAGSCPGTRIAIIGYSQGADAAGDLAAEIGTGVGVVPADRIAAVGLISDPRRSPTDALVGPPVGGAGAGGPRVGGFGFVSQQTRTFCAIGDLYCSTASDDFVTRFAGFLAQSSNPDPAQLWRYQQEAGAIFADLMAGGGFALLESQLSDQANQQRRQQLEAFFESGAHQDYNSYVVDRNGSSATSWLRNWLIGVA